MTHPLQRLRLPAAALGFALAAGACGGDRGGPGAARDQFGEPVPGGTAITIELADLARPLSIINESALDGSAMNMMFMGVQRGAWRDGRLVFLNADESPMALARRWELTGPDSTTMRFFLRSDVVWSDGVPVTAADVVYTYELMADPAVASPRQDYAERIRLVEAENDSTVSFHFHNRYPVVQMQFYANLQAVPRHVFEGSDPANLRNHPRMTNPEGGNLPVNGPYMVGTWERGSRVTMVRNPRFRPQPYLDQTVMRVVPAETTRMVEFQTGRADMLTPVPPEQVPTLRRNVPGVQMEREQGRFYDFIGYNPRVFEPFADREVRIALGLAIDSQGLIDGLNISDYAVPAGGPYAPIFSDLYDPQAHAPMPFDPDSAVRILERKGWRPGPDGVLVREGRPFRFTLVTNAGNQRRIDATQILQQMWRRIGVDAQLQTMETNTFFDRMTQKRFEAVLAGWSVGLSPDLEPLWGRDTPYNYVSYENPQAWELFDRARTATDEAEANRLWSEAAGLIVADQPYTWLYFRDEIVALSQRLRGAHIDTYSRYQNVWEWWIPADMQRGRAGAAAVPTDTAAADTQAR
jgi:peptide/nickel transport system substrate-binding protein